MNSIERQEIPKQFERTLRLAVFAPFGLAVVLMLLLGLAIGELRTAANWVDHTTAVQAQNLPP